MSLDDLPAGSPARPAAEAGAAVRRVDRASPYPEKITRAEELRLQLADEIVRGRAGRRDRRSTRRTSPSASTFRARRCARRCASSWLPGLVDAPRASRRGGGAALDRTPDRDVRGDGGIGGDLRRARRGPDDADRAPAAGSHSRGTAGAELRRQSGPVPRSQRALPQRDLCRLAEHYIAEITLATRVRVQPFRPRPVPQSRAAGEIACRARTASWSRFLRGDKTGAEAAMRAHIELVRDEYEIYAVSV